MNARQREETLYTHSLLSCWNQGLIETEEHFYSLLSSHP